MSCRLPHHGAHADDFVILQNTTENPEMLGNPCILTEEEAEKLIAPFRKELQEKMTEYSVPAMCVYNGDQTGLFYSMLPNTLYIKEDERKNFRGVKAMKSKERVTVMITTSAEGDKVPLTVVGKAAKPECFRNLPGKTKTPLPYTNQKSAWFEKYVMEWYLKEVFWKHFMKVHSPDQHCILILDNFGGHKLDENCLPKIFIFYSFHPTSQTVISPRTWA